MTESSSQNAADLDEARVREILRLTRTSFRTLADFSPLLVALYRGGKVVFVNSAAASATGRQSPEELEGAPVRDVFHPDDLEALEQRLRASPGSPAHESLGLRWRGAEAKYRATDAVVARVDDGGSPTLLVVARTGTNAVEGELQMLQRDRMAALGTLSAGVAHEINNPLTYLLVNLEHVLRRLRAASASDDPIAELAHDQNAGITALVQALQQAVEGANRVRQIVRHLLTFAQGNIEQRGMVDVRGIVESATQMAWHEIRHRAHLVKSLAEVPPVDANEARLGQVFLNLLVNAAQAIPEGQADRHEVRVVTRTDERGNAIVEVSDTGTGIAPESLPRIFDPFFTTKGEHGTGLGLSISLGTIRSLGGEITATSTPGKGTTFRVRLPSAKAMRGSAPTTPRDDQVAARRRVLVIDDERLVGEAIARSLSEDNDVQVVTDAEHALEKIAAGEHYDIVLCDLMMPVMTGMDLYAEIVRTSPKLAGRFVFMTGGAFTPRARAFVESVVNPCLEKPIDMGRVRSLVALAGRP
jgi:PAS domain S-box-containing protein